MTGSQFRYMLYTIIYFFALVPWLPLPLPLSQATRHVYSNTRIDVLEKERLYKKVIFNSPENYYNHRSASAFEQK